MDALFLKIINLSIMGSYFALAVMIFRKLFKKAPKWLSCLLWGFVGLRLINPFSFESVLSLIPSKETFPQKMLISSTPEIQSGVERLNSMVNPVISEALAPQTGASVNPMQVFGSIMGMVWISGVVITLLYCTFTYIRLKRKVKEAMKLHENIYICDGIDTPFILGVIKPKVYLPSSLKENDRDFVITHEKAHLKRRDNLWKPLGFLVLSLHWFNPLMWFCYKLFSTDIELACDEKVLNEMGGESKKSYSTALINCASPSRLISPCPLAFGETGVKERVKSILNYKKPAFWVLMVCIILSGVLSFCFLSDPKDYKNSSIVSGTYEVSENLYNFVSPNKNYSNTFCITDNFELVRSFEGSEWESYGQLEKVNLTKEDILKNAPYDDEGWMKNYRIGEIKEAYVTIKEGEQSDGGKYIVLTEKGDLLYISATLNETGIQPVIIDKLKKTVQAYSREYSVSPETEIEVSYSLEKRDGDFIDFGNATKEEIKTALTNAEISLSDAQLEEIIENSEKYTVVDIKTTVRNLTDTAVYPENIILPNTFAVFFDTQGFERVVEPGEERTFSEIAIIEKDKVDLYTGNKLDRYILSDKNGEEYTAFMKFEGVLLPTDPPQADESFTTTAVVDNTVSYTELKGKTFKSAEEV